jgi:hypothetical protein
MKLLDDLKERRGYSHLKEEALDHTMWRACFGRGFGPVVRQTTKRNEELCVLYIGRAYRYPPDVAFYILFSTNIITEYFKHAAHSLFFSSKCHLFNNATFLFPILFTFYIQVC